VTPTSFNLGESENLLVRLRRFGGRHPLSVWETLVLLGISLLGFYIISILHPPKAPTAPAFSKDVRYRITLRNPLNRPVSQAGVWLPAPAAEDAARRCDLIQVDHPHELIPNTAGETEERDAPIAAQLAAAGIKAVFLEGGLSGWHRHLHELALSGQPRESRLRTISLCRPCGEKQEAAEKP
jgi:hypothetical protein